MKIVIDIDENIFTRLFDNGTEDYAIMNDDLFAIAKSIRNGTPLPKTGHWICHRDHCENLGVIPSGLGVYEWCSNCDCGIDIREWQRNHYNYCPNCGVDMRGESE